ncbi:MAG: type II toxin-antitoxin system VapC family toxin [Gallionellaceae bacterium]
MRVLLDTHAFLWWIWDAPELSAKARKYIANPENECLLSLASVWEIAIKSSLGKLKIDRSLDQFIPEQLSANGFKPLEIGFRHIVQVNTMPFHHKDPFDRLLAAQAQEEKLLIISADPIFTKYGIKRIW